MDPNAGDVPSSNPLDRLATGTLPRLSARLGHALRGGHGGPRGSVELALVVELDDLRGREHPGRHGREPLEQHRSDGEVRGDDHVRLVAFIRQ